MTVRTIAAMTAALLKTSMSMRSIHRQVDCRHGKALCLETYSTAPFPIGRTSSPLKLQMASPTLDMECSLGVNI